MTTSSYRSIRSGSALTAVAMLFSVSAYAQGASDEIPQNEVAEDVVESPAKVRRLDEIVVTAQRREQDVMEVPISITVVTTDDMEELDVTSSRDLVKMVPNLELLGSGISNSITMRGLGTIFNNGADQAVGIFVDEVYYSGAEKLSNLPIDIKAIEVLRGPQGTLFGRNTIAGAILFTTNDVSEDWEFEGDFLYGDRGRVEGGLLMNMPIAEGFGFRGQAQYWNHNGNIDNRLQGRGDNVARAVRGKLQYDPTDNFRISLGGFHQEAQQERIDSQYYNLQPQHKSLGQRFDPEIEGNLEDRTHSTNRWTGGEEFHNDLRLNAKLNWADHMFTFVAGWYESGGDGGYDVDEGPIPLIDGYGFRAIQEHSAEFRINSDHDGAFQYVGGLYYFGGDRQHYTVVDLFPIPTAFTLADLSVLNFGGVGIEDIVPILGPESLREKAITDFNMETQSLSAYGQLDWTIFDDALTLIAGARIAEDKKDLVFTGRVSGADGTIDEAPLLNYSAGAENFDAIRDISYSMFDWKGSVVFRASEEVNIYGTVATGSKSGGFNASAFNDNSELTFGPESSITYEGGVKTVLFNGLTRATLALFYTDFQDLQATVFTGTGFVVANASEVVSQGIEVEWQSALPWGFFTRGGYAYLDAAIGEWTNAPCTAEEGGGAECDASGRDLPNIPKHQIQMSLSHSNDLGNLPYRLTIGGDVNWRSETDFSVTSDPLHHEEAYAIWNARVAFEDDDGRWSIVGYMHNLFDEAKKTASYDPLLLTGTKLAVVTPGRRGSIQLKVNF